MLVLARKTQESIVIGEQIEIVVIGVKKNRVRLGISAPPEIAVNRAERSTPPSEELLLSPFSAPATSWSPRAEALETDAAMPVPV